MFGIQVSIGALNDLVDQPNDAREKPGKPLPRGLVGRPAARRLTFIGGFVGLALSLLSGWAAALVAAAGAGLGYAYDLRLSRGTLSWLPLSLALPLLPIYAWLGATGSIPPDLLTLVPVGVLAGGGLALANGLVDLERDARSGRAATVVALGRNRAWLVQSGALAIAAVIALLVGPAVPATVAGSDEGLRAALRALRFAGMVLGVGLIAVGSGCLAAGQPALRERGWELEALGVAGLGIGWLAGTAAAIGVVG
jgi:4-hydroxybenzoate polyprenyltransferase